MIPAALLQDTLDLLSEIETTPRPADAVSSAFFRGRPLDDHERGAVLELVYVLLRHRARLGWWLARQGLRDTARNRVLVWAVRGAGLAPEAAGRLFASAGLSTERAVLAGMSAGIDHPDMPEAVRLECPDWALGPLKQRFGAGFAAEMAAMLGAPPLDLRVNPVKTTRDAVLRGLLAQGIAAEPMPLASQGIRIGARLSLARLAGLKSGEIEIQDEGSQLVAELVGARPGERVVDFCAGAGGKALALAAAMGNRGHLIACDVNEARLKRAAERLRRAGLHNVETRVLASETDKWVKRHKLGYDRVLIDAPCSGTGTWRRNPDARWRAPDLGLAGLCALQARILASAARLVRPGGRLVYATCSVLVEENEAQVQAFLAATPGFRQVPVSEVAPGLTRGLDLSLTPLQNGTDGFFAAVLERAP